MSNRFTPLARTAGHVGSPWRKPLCLALTVTVSLAGCGNLPVVPERNPAETTRPAPTTLAVVPVRFEPKGNTGPLTRTKGGAAAEGAAGGAAYGLGSSLLVGDPLLAVIMLPVMVPLGLIAGAVGGASAGSSSEAIEQSARTWEKATREAQLQQRLQNQIVAELQKQSVARQVLVKEALGPASPEEKPRYEQIGADTVLEVGMMELKFSPVAKTQEETAYSLAITVRARAIDTKDQAVLDEMKPIVYSPAHTATEWLKDNAAVFTQEVDKAMARSAEAIVLEFFRIYYPPAELGNARVGLFVAPYYVLQPEYPPPRKWHRNTQLTGELQPTFRWESFPRPIDLQGLGGVADRISDVTYDFALYSATENKNPFSVILRCSISRGLDCPQKPPFTMGPRIYQRTGLPAPQHQLEMPLQPCGQYAWTMRAQFRLDGHPRITEWSGTYLASQPWQSRRALLSSYGEFLQEWNVSWFLFRAPPADGATACPD